MGAAGTSVRLLLLWALKQVQELHLGTVPCRKVAARPSCPTHLPGRRPLTACDPQS
jgi:hypothetical protein